MGDLAVGGNSVCCLIIFVIYIGLGRAYRLRGDFEVLKWRGEPKRDRNIFMREVDPSRHLVKIIIWQL